MSSVLLRPGAALGLYPQKQDADDTGLARANSRLEALFNRSPRLSSAQLARINAHGSKFAEMESVELAEQLNTLRMALMREGLTEALILQSFALIREKAERTLGMRHFDSQLQGAWVMINGMLAEMETGEGKTLAATLPAATAALAGIPVHIVTVNDYLAKRDVSNMGRLYWSLGLSVGAVVEGMDPTQRRAAYARDITYCTNKQLAFDYLRDRIVMGNDASQLRLQLEQLHKKNPRAQKLLLRGLCFAIVDEADSVLIDEARTPLVISRERKNENEQTIYIQALALTSLLEEHRDFTIDKLARKIELSVQGRTLLAELAQSLGGVWAGAKRREELMLLALKAQHLLHRDRHYLIKQGKIKIIDENTGRLMPDRVWDHGLHQMIEAKEECELSGQQESVAQFTYQRFFRRYLKLAGMTGTAQEAANELWSIYQLKVVTIAGHRPMQRKQYPTRVFSNKERKWAAICERIEEIYTQARPVLVGTRTVADSEMLSELLHKAGLPHQVLNARQDAHEAQIIAQAGQVGRITVATNMAGRGTDIQLGHGVAEVGGLHVIATEWNEARRIDRQLYGRCGRQGDPGSFEAMLSLEDELAQVLPQTMVGLLVRLPGNEKSYLKQKLIIAALRHAQRLIERRHRHIRRGLLRMDQQIGKLLAFSGRME